MVNITLLNLLNFSLILLSCFIYVNLIFEKDPITKKKPYIIERHGVALTTRKVKAGSMKMLIRDIIVFNQYF